MSSGMIEVVELLLSESSQLSEEKLLMVVSMCESKRAAEWLGVSQLAHIHASTGIDCFTHFRHFASLFPSNLV